MDQIILKYLMEELTFEEQHKLSKWLDADPLNQVILEKFEQHWKTKTPNLNEQREEVLKRIKSEMHEGQPIKSKPSMLTFPLRYLKYAAIFFIVFTGTYIINQNTDKTLPDEHVRYIEKTSLMGQKINLRLPDGTQVKLNANSKLTVPEKFSNDRREVELVGEAFFDVAENAEKPFIIRMEAFTVEVKGTSFGIKAYPDEEKMVAVKSGIVAVSSEQIGKSVQLEKDEMSMISLQRNTLEKGHIEDSELIFGWVNQDLIFKNQKWQEVVKEIEKWYGVTVVNGGGDAANKLYTARHDDNPSLEQVMESVSFVFEVEFEIKGDELIIK